MSFTESILSSNLLSSFGWTIIHSIWIGGIIFLFAWILLYLFRNGKANHRYTIAVASLFVFLTLVTVAFFKVYALQNINYSLNLSIGENFRNLSYNIIEASNLTNLTTNFSLESIENYINQNIPILVVVWLIGLLFFTLRFFGGLLYTYRMRSKSQKIRNHEITGIFHQISQKIGLSSKVQIKETSLISTPMVIGFIKPIILLPLGMANGLSLHQVEAILFHEIAHIYRFDYIVNLIQSMVEVILFYHPVVWWLSSHIRAERENICDDIAIEHTGSALNYAKALTSLQELNKQTPDIVLAFSNKKYRFMNRIRRLLGLPLIENNLIEGLISSLLLIVSIILFTTHAGPVFAQVNENNLSDRINSNTAEVELPLIQDQDKKTGTELDDMAKKIEQALLKNRESIDEIVNKLSGVKKTFTSNTFKVQEELNKKGKLDQKTIDEIQKKSIGLSKAIQINLDQQKDNHKIISKKIEGLKTELNSKVAERLTNELLKNKEMLLKASETIKITQQELKNQSIKMAELSQMDQKELQKKMAQKQNMTKEQQKKLQYELQKMEDYQKKTAQFSEQASEELKKKYEHLKQLQLEMEKTKPSEEKMAKLKAMEKELVAQKAEFTDMKMAQEKKLKELKNRKKDQIADIRKIDELEEAEMEKEIEKVMEVEKIREAMIEKEIEMEREMDEDIKRARLADPEMIKKEMAYKKVIEIFAKNLLADGLMKKGERLEFMITTNELTIAGKKQSKKLFKKYSKLYADTKGEKLTNDNKFILNF